ncbi:hypothetical protein IJ596_03895 [bacterium]|nr:hypothetical protein [bacterium]
MLLQSIPSQNYNRYTYTLSQKPQNAMSFSGELGDKFIENVQENNNMSDEDLTKRMQDHGFLQTRFGHTYMPKSSLKDLLESLCEALKNQNKAEREADESVKTTETRHSALRKEVENATNLVIKTETEQIRAQIMTDLQKRVEELQQRDAQLQKKDAALNDRLKGFSINKDKIDENMESAFRVVNGIENSEVSLYKNIGEQLYVVGKSIKSHKNKLTNKSSSTLVEIAKVMQNNEGNISVDMIDFVDKALEAQNMTVKNLKSAISMVKDENGNINPEKANVFLTCHKVINPSRVKPDFEKIYQVLLTEMQNNEGKIPDQTVKFLENLLKADEYPDMLYLPSAVFCVKDENGNIDGDKVKSFFAYYSCKDSSLHSTIEFIQKRYKIPDECQDLKDFISERIQKVQELAYKINSHKDSAGQQKFKATVNKKGFLDIISMAGYMFHPQYYKCDSNEAFELIESIIATVDFDSVEHLTDVGNLRFINGNVYGLRGLSNHEQVRVTGTTIS